MSHTRIIAPIDEDGDGFDDVNTKLGADSESALGVLNNINRGSFDTNKELTLVYPLERINYDESLQAEIISDNDNFQVNGLAEVIIAFDRPVELIHGVRQTYDTLVEAEVLISIQDTALIFDANKVNQATTTQGEASLALDNTTNVYTYKNDDGEDVTLDLGRDSTDKVASTYVTDYKVETITRELASSEYSLSAGGTLLTISLDSSGLLADHTYDFEVAVKGVLDNNPAAFMTFSKVAKSNATTALADLLVDNFDYKDTTTYDPSGSTDESDLPNQTDHTDKFRSLNVGVTGADPADKAQLQYLLYTDSGFDTLAELNVDNAINQSRNVVYLVSKAKLSGSVQAVEQVETDYINDADVSEKVVSSSDYFRLDINDANINDNGDLQQFISVSSSKLFLF
ncbi:MAG: hypothetical protein HWE10_10090 [Gammaproteobacteria bacterium]|nr:hypothetical protein [Gammaproteobacteria bacterium]